MACRHKFGSRSTRRRCTPSVDSTAFGVRPRSDPFHISNRIDSRAANHLGSFFVEGVGETDGVHYLPVPIGRRYPLGLLVVQNGDAPEPSSTDPVNWSEFNGSTQRKYVDFSETLTALWR